MTNTTATRRFVSVYDLKGGDTVFGKEVYDVVDTFGGRQRIKFTDGTDQVVDNGAEVIVTN